MTILPAAVAAVLRAVRLGFYCDAEIAARTLRGTGTNPAQLYNAMLGACEAGGARPAHGRALAGWLAAVVASEKAGDPPRDDWRPPFIVIEAGNLPGQIDALEDALADARLGLYRRGGDLVRVGTDSDGESPHVLAVSEDYLVELGSRAAQFQAERPVKGNPARVVNVDCPRALARGVLARRGFGSARLPKLAGVIYAPTLRADGTLLDLPGYDPATGLYLDTSGLDMPAVPERPTAAQAARALDQLAGLLAEFCFVDDVSRAVALSAMLTAVVRPALPAAPLHAITATAPGSGKSYLTDMVAMLATGRPASPMAAGADDAELEKRLGAALLASQPLIVLDNVSRAVNGDLLNQMITQERVAPRRLGVSELVEVRNTAMLLMNGNNLAIPADMARRVVLCSLDTREERPELRRYSGRPLDRLRESRGDYLAAALTVLRGYIAAGQPDMPEPIGSFEAWSNLVRGALLWCEEADPATSMEAVREADPRRAEATAVMGGWNEAIGDARVSVNEVIDRAICHAEFREALLAVAGERGAINGRRLGLWLGRNRGRIVDGRCFEAAPQRRGIATWILSGACPASQVGTVCPFQTVAR